jgi:hypothetical protein
MRPLTAAEFCRDATRLQAGQKNAEVAGSGAILPEDRVAKSRKFLIWLPIRRTSRVPAIRIRALWKKISNSFQSRRGDDCGLPTGSI